MIDRLGMLAADFAAISLLSVGGASSVLPEMHRSLVDVHGWMSSREFADLFALAQAAPGPNVLVVSLLGWKAAGLAGALVATVAMILPSSLLTFYADRAWRGTAAAAWRDVIDNGLAPITVGLIAAGGATLAVASDSGLLAVLMTAASALIAWRTRLHPLWMIAAGALAGVAGIV